jgi:hypothetical protein
MRIESDMRELGDELERRHEGSELDADALLARILAEAPGRPRRPRGWAAGVALAAAAVIAAILLPTGGSGPIAPADASATLRELSVLARAREQREPPIADGQYFYRRTQGYGSTGESWTDRKGIGAFWNSNIEDGRRQRITARDAVPILLGKEELSYEEMLDLPRDPGKLLAVTRRATFNARELGAYEGTVEEDQALFRTIQSFLVEAPAPSDLRAAFYGALARLDHMRVVGQARTAFGKSGVAIGIWFAGGPYGDEIENGPPGTVREDLIFDRGTGALIGTRTLSGGEVSGGALQTGVVDGIGQRP